MELSKRTTLHYQQGTSDKIYEVDLCKTGENSYLVNFRYGRRGKALKDGTKTTKAVSFKEAEKIFNRLVASKMAEGYLDITATSATITPRDAVISTDTPVTSDPRYQAILNRLTTRNEEKWPLDRVIWRAGELKIKEATPLLIELIGTGSDLRNYCLAWALGWCGDERAISPLQLLHQNKSNPEFVRRIAWEAHLKLVDEPTKAQMRRQKIGELPPVVREVVESGNTEGISDALKVYFATPITVPPEVEEFTNWLRRGQWWQWYNNESVRLEVIQRREKLPPEWRKFVEPLPEIKNNRYNYWNPHNLEQELNRYRHQEKGKLYSAIDTLYHIDSPVTRPFILDFVKTASLKDTTFQAIRHIFKIAEYRQDSEIFAILAYRFATAKVSGYYYNSFKEATRFYLNRRVWTTLRKLGEEGDRAFTNLAVDILLQYTDADAQPVRETIIYRWDYQNSVSKTHKVTWGTYGSYLAFNHLLYENSPRFALDKSGKAWRFKENYQPTDPIPEGREEAFPHLWEQNPEGLWRLLMASECHPVHQFAVKALAHCTAFCQRLEVNQLLQLINKTYPETIQLGFELARSHYNPQQPNLALVEALLNCGYAPAREQAQQWLQQKPEFFSQQIDLIVSLIFSIYRETRTFTRQFLQVAMLPQDKARVFIGKIIAQLLNLGEDGQEMAADGGETLLVIFANYLRNLGLNVVTDLLDHPLVEVQRVGVRILLDHETSANNLPPQLIESLINSPHEEIRRLGVQLFGQLPDDRLLEDPELLLAMVTASQADLRQSIKPIIRRLASAYQDLESRLVGEVIELLMIPEKDEGVHQDLVLLLREDLRGWKQRIDKYNTIRLLKCQDSGAQELGGLALQEHYRQWLPEFSTSDIVKWASHDVLVVRETARSMFNDLLETIRTNPQEMLVGVRLLESKWEDTKEYARQVFNGFTSNDWSPEVIVSVCDSIVEDVRQFGRDLAINTFQQGYGEEYLLKFSEHPSLDMQVFVTNYLENYAGGDSDRLRQLTPYFITVLSQVNRGRVAKDRIFAFLDRESQKSEEAAGIVAEILTRQSLTIAIGDKAKTIQMMLKLRQRYPQLNLPIQVQEVTTVRR